MQKLGQKAAQVQQAMEAMPGKIAHLRETVAMTTSQLQQLRSGVQASVADLRVDSEARLINAMEEINDSTDIFLEAGFELIGVDMEFGPSQRVIVHLTKVEEVSPSAVGAVLAANQQRKTTLALLRALTQADEVAQKVDLKNLSYRKAMVHLGPIPVVRLCWRPEEEIEEEETVAATPASVSPPPPAPPPPSVFAQSSFFERRPAQPSQAAVAASSPPGLPAGILEGTPAPVGPRISEPVQELSPASATAVKSDWKQGALDRFKKMPDFSKYRR